MISETYVFGIIAGVGFSIAILLLVPIFIDAMSVYMSNLFHKQTE